MSLVKISGNASGTGTLTVAAPNTNSNYTITLPTNTGTILTSATTTGFPAGSVLQVVQTQLTSVQTFSPTAKTFTDITGASVSITPSSTSNKILIIYTTFMTSSQNTAYWMQYARITRNGSAVSIGTQASYLAAGAANYSANNQYGGQIMQVFLDSPSTTSAITYQLQGAGESNFSVGGSYSSGTGNPSVPTTIIAMEIAG